MLSDIQIETILINIVNSLQGLTFLESIAILEVVKYNLLMDMG